MSRSTQQNTWMQDEGVKHDTYASNGNKNSNHRQGKAEELKAFLEGTSLHGASFLYDSNVFRRIFWTVILLINQPFLLYLSSFRVYICILSAAIRYDSGSV